MVDPWSWYARCFAWRMDEDRCGQGGKGLQRKTWIWISWWIMKCEQD